MGIIKPESWKIIAIVSIEHSLRPTEGQINTVHKKAEVVSIHGEVLPMVRLYKLFGVEPDSQDPAKSSVVVVDEDGQRGCLMVDELLGQHNTQVPGILAHGL